MIESLVAILLLLTILYCVVLNSRLKQLKADEQALQRDHLRTDHRDRNRRARDRRPEGDGARGEQTLGERLRARRSAVVRRLDAAARRPAKMLLGRADRASPARSRQPSGAGAAAPDAKAVAAAAQAFAERARARARRPRRMMRCRARFPADPGRADRDGQPVRAQGLGLVFDGGYTLGRAAAGRQAR